MFVGYISVMTDELEESEELNLGVLSDAEDEQNVDDDASSDETISPVQYDITSYGAD